MDKDVLNRVGDEVICKGVCLKMVFELKEFYSDVTLTILVIKSARGDGPTRVNLFSGSQIFTIFVALGTRMDIQIILICKF